MLRVWPHSKHADVAGFAQTNRSVPAINVAALVRRYHYSCANAAQYAGRIAWLLPSLLVRCFISCSALLVALL
jgi:hypothetical protein